MVSAWGSIRDDQIRRAFVSSVLNRLRNHNSGFPKRIGLRSRNNWTDCLAEDGERRALVLRSALLAVEQSPYILRALCSTLPVAPTDSEFLLEMARDGDDALRGKISTVFFMLDRADANVLTAIYRGTQERVIEGTLGSLLNVELGSGTAQQLRAECEREERQALADQNAVENKLRALNQLLDRSENGEAGAWLSIWDSVLVAKWPGVPSWGGASRLDQLACWVYFDNVTRERLYLAAQRYLLIGARPALELFSETGWPSWVSAEFSALLNTFERFRLVFCPWIIPYGNGGADWLCGTHSKDQTSVTAHFEVS